MNPPIAPTNPLDQLKDIHLPEAPGLWPPAPGWWILAISLLVLIATTLVLLIRYRNKNRYRKVALQQADHLMREFQQSEKSDAAAFYIEQAMALLKRVSLHRNLDEQMAALSADRYLDRLNQHCKKPVFSEQICSQIAPTLYAAPSSTRQPDLDIHRFHNMMKTWIKRHR